MAEALALGAGTWNALLEGSPRVSPFSGWAWHESWAETALPEELERVVTLVSRGADGSVEALLPLRLASQRFRRFPAEVLSWAIGDDGCPDHLDFPALPGAGVDALADELLRAPWHVLLLMNVEEQAANVQRLAAAMSARGCAVRRRPMTVCRFIELPESWDAYLAGFSASRVKAIRRNERVLSRDHQVTVTFHDEASLDSGWQRFVALHKMRWGLAGGYADERQLDLTKRYAASQAREGTLWLATLSLDGEPAAAWSGFSRGDTLYYYQSGFDPKWRKEGVGQVLLGLVIQRAIERGFRRFDFLRGDEPYKKEWAHASRTCYEWCVFRPGLRGLLLRGLDWVALRREGRVVT
jgi:CelD/BcsL family acetyltransferase involved in cellulose biosynthesis